MTTELTVLALAGLLQGIQFMLMAVPVNREIGTSKTMSPRDEARLGGPIGSQVSVPTGRLIRAMNNHFEALILFTIAVVVISQSGQSSGFTGLCAWSYLLARLLYIPAYVFGWVPWRSIIWAVSFLASMAMMLAALF
ncbi:MAPEG family protein [Granulosicoccus antarcticus]|uniref:MAPEG family protein n=1 Tax=Granulosicoccus antarcticus IMCC3135 TaxID=1192854 RepID=A0A2Z2NI75_9GAMM|nr:MAPEG family protein [Granulosicoccus antarcticus]ASJ71032.1 hypothetical protein IMCC3135_04595 [Granulosicoccus antarcticus IMCC3135]